LLHFFESRLSVIVVVSLGLSFVYVTSVMLSTVKTDKMYEKTKARKQALFGGLYG
jgi:hypothetical protein